MATSYPHETFVHRRVKYTIDVNDELIVIENVPARVCVETGEQLFSPETVERLQKMISNKSKPKRVMEVPVFEFA
jgi:YgiT-type zinc finger domain-containing protein